MEVPNRTQMEALVSFVNQTPCWQFAKSDAVKIDHLVGPVKK